MNILPMIRGRRGICMLVCVALAWALGACSGTASRGVDGVVGGQGAANPSPGHGVVLREDYQVVRDHISALIERVRAKYDIAGLSIALVEGQEVVWAEGFGHADVAAGLPATPDTVYRVGSVAKPFTATAVMQLEEQGLVDIDQPLFFYLPQFDIHTRFMTTADPITVRSVLTHHAGLPTDLNKGMWTNRPFTGLTEALHDEYTAYPPNLVFSYSNVGYSLLGHMLQQTTGEGFERYMDESVFRPLGMAHTGYRVTPAMRPMVAKGYHDGKELKALPIRDLPAFGLRSSAIDLARFVEAMLDQGRVGEQRLLDENTVGEMFEVQNADVPLDLRVRNGIGWFLESDTVPGGGYVVRHGGTTLSFTSEMILLPEHQMGVVVLANTSGTRKVVSHLAEDTLAMALERNDRNHMSHQFYLRWPDQEPDQAREEKRGSLTGGNYATGMGLVAIRPESAELCACVVEKTLDLIPYPDGWFGIRQASVDSLPPSMHGLGKLRFATRTIDDRQVIVAKRDGKEVLLGEKMPPQQVSDAWLRRVGKYRLLNPDPGFPLEEPEVWYRHGTLGMSYKLPLLSSSTITVPLQPISDNQAIIMGLGRMRGETLHVLNKDGVETLRYSGFEGKKR